MQSSATLLLLLVCGTSAFMCPPIPCSALPGLGVALGYSTVNAPFAYTTTLPNFALLNTIEGFIPDVAFSVGCNLDWANNFGTLLPPGVFRTLAGAQMTGAFMGPSSNVSGVVYDGKSICMCF